MSGPATVSGSSGEFALPVGTVTFLLTDVEGSTSAWQAAPEAMGGAIARHYEMLDAAVAAHGGVRPQEQGESDSIVAAFGRASDALKAAVAAQQSLSAEPWPDGLAGPIRVRMAIHTGEAQMRDEANYVGQAIIRTARLRAIAHGGQVLASQAVRDLVIDQLGDRIELLDLGVHRLKDLARPEHVWQVAAEGMDRAFPPLKSLDAVPNNLPTELSSFVGRQTEIAALCALVAGNRLVTINGAGGAGKTRLAQQVAAQLSDSFPDGTWWVELAPVDASAVRGTIASVVSINDPNRLVERLGGRMLLVLDNCEHVLDVISPLVHQVMGKCPDVTVLATSRGALDVPGEVTWRVPPLSAPPVGEAVAVDRLGQFDAVRLFVDRAKKARPNFVLTTENGPAVAALCARLDGIPLAIELAAARVKSLTAEQILIGLEDALRLLTGGSRLVMPRQQTLEASIGWSHNLLGERERVLLRRLSVFAGGWELSDAEAVCAHGSSLAAIDVLDGLERLIDQSLVRVHDGGGIARYQLLETVRQFAARQLATFDDEREAVVSQHTAWFAQLAAAVGPLAETSQQDACVARLLPERDNLALAMRQLLTTGEAVALAVMALNLGPFWNAADLPADGRTWTTSALDAIGDGYQGLRARLLSARGMHFILVGNFLVAPAGAQAATDLAESLGDRRSLGRSRLLLANTMAPIAPEAAVLVVDQAVDDCGAAGDLYVEAQALLHRAVIYTALGKMPLVREALAVAEPKIRELASPFLTMQWNSWRAGLSLATGDHEAMQAAIQTGSPYEIRHSNPGNRALLTTIAITLAADTGSDIPTPDALEALAIQMEKAENYFGAIQVTRNVIRSLFLRGELPRALTVADDAAARLPIPWAHWYVDAALASGDLDGARQRMERATTVPTAWALFTVCTVNAFLARHDGKIVTAEAIVHEGLAFASQNEMIRNVVDAIEMLAGLAAAQGAWQHAARLGGAAHAKRETHPLKARTEPIRSMLDADMAATRAALGDEAFRNAFEEGGRLSLDEAIEYARRARG